MPPCKLVIFDKDGTLLDDAATWVPPMLTLAEKLSPLISGGATRVLELLGLDAASGTFTSESMFMTATNAEVFEYLAQEANEATATAYADFLREMPPPEGVPIVPLQELFRELRGAGIQVAVLTSDNRRFANDFLERQGVLDLVSTMVCGDDGLPPKPSHEPVLAICKRIGVQPEEAAMVGDSASRDIGCGLAANLGSVIGVVSGISTEEELLNAGAHAVVPSVAEVHEALRQRLNRPAFVTSAVA